MNAERTMVGASSLFGRGSSALNVPEGRDPDRVPLSEK